jgi:hypothetical protein
VIRTVVYRDGEVPADPPPAGSAGRRRQRAKDGYLERLVKYVPAEVTAVFAPLAAAADSVKGDDWILSAVIVAGFIATPLYLFGRSRSLPKLKRPKWFFYVLATVAFGFWALGVSGSTRDLVEIDDTTAEVLLGLAALLLPGIDMALEAVFDRD